MPQRRRTIKADGIVSVRWYARAHRMTLGNIYLGGFATEAEALAAENDFKYYDPPQNRGNSNYREKGAP